LKLVPTPRRSFVTTTISTNTPRISVRRGKISDAARVAELAGQLGYPATKKEMAQRIKRLSPPSQHAFFVAVLANRVIGWVGVSASRLLEVPPRAEVDGLVIDEAVRSRGVGRLLLKKAEAWAKHAGCKSMSVRSNIKRKRAHEFYKQNGYEHYKTQKAFHKKI
jgi:GNAT superfamily N-acetyltransferase